MTSESDSDSDSISTSSSEPDSTLISNLSLVHESESPFKFERRFALIFGNNGYRGRPLKSCHKDARDMEKVLTTLGKFIKSLFEEATCHSRIAGFICIVVLDTTKKHMESEINEICKKIKEDDCLLVYFSGHGEESEVRQNKKRYF